MPRFIPQGFSPRYLKFLKVPTHHRRMMATMHGTWLEAHSGLNFETAGVHTLYVQYVHWTSIWKMSVQRHQNLSQEQTLSQGIIRAPLETVWRAAEIFLRRTARHRHHSLVVKLGLLKTSS